MSQPTPEAISAYLAQNPRILSIQSHVVSGYVGNRCAVFPLQILGFDVDFINTVQFSNHTGYPSWTGEKLTGDQLLELLKGLERNGLDNHSHLITGYLGSVSVAAPISQILQHLRRKNPNLVYVCDPVMGDEGKLYIPEAAVAIYREQLVPNSTIITPNQFEAELLTQFIISSEETALLAIDKLHNMGPPVVILTSLFYGPSDEIIVIASKQLSSSSPPKRVQVKFTVPRLPRYFTGTGDLFSALILAWSAIHSSDTSGSSVEEEEKEKESFKLVCEKAVSTLQLVLRETIAADAAAELAGVRTASLRGGELRLIQSKKHLESPTILYRATPISS